MDRKIKSFKTKVITKLFGQSHTTPDERDDSDDQSSDSIEQNVTPIAKNSPPSSGHSLIDHDVVLYGVHRCPTGTNIETNSNEPACNVGSASPISDGDGSENVVQRKRKRRRRHGLSGSGTNGKHPAPTSCGSTESMKSSSLESVPPTSHTKNQKRKLKKKRREKVKRAEASIGKELTFDCSGKTSE